jgi:uncharacterized membrane protein YhhN
MQLALIPPIVISVSLLIRAEFAHNQRQIRVFKPISTLLVFAVALLSLWTPGGRTGYTIGILVGLALSFAGDMALMGAWEKTLRLGLVFFLLAHLAYTVTLTLYNGLHLADLIHGVVLLVLGIAIYRYLEPGLNEMKGPVVVYLVVICLMVNRALSTFSGTSFSPAQAWLVSIGSILFWVSDLILAVTRYRQPWKYGRISLAFYYSGQLLIALSASF